MTPRPLDAIPRFQWARHLPNERAMRYPPGATIIAQGDAPDPLQLITTGIAKVVRSEPGGRDVIVAFREPGWLLGVAAAVLGEVQMASAIAAGWCEVRPLSLSLFQAAINLDTAARHATESMLAREQYEHVERAGWPALPVLTRIERAIVWLLRDHGKRREDGSESVAIVRPRCLSIASSMERRVPAGPFDYILSDLRVRASCGRISRRTVWQVQP